MRKYVPKRQRQIPTHAKRVFEGEIHDVYQWQQELFDGSMATYEMLDRPDTVMALCVKGDKLIIQDEEQPHVGHFYGFPGGKADIDSETELDAIKREVLEETGMTFKSWKLIYTEQFMNKVDHVYYLFLAYDYEKTVEHDREGGEKISAIECDLDEFRGYVTNDKFDEYVPLSVMAAESVDDIINLPDLYHTA